LLGGDGSAKDDFTQRAGVLVDGGYLVSIDAVSPAGRTVADAGPDLRLPPSAVDAIADADAGSVTIFEPVGGDPGIEGVLVPVRTKDAPLGAVVAQLSLPRLVDAAFTGAWPAGRTVSIRATGADKPLFSADKPPDLLGQSGEAVARALNPVDGSATVADAKIGSAGFTDWSIEIRDLLSVAGVPVMPVIALVVVSLALVGLIIWMARRVLEPAVQLDKARHRLGTLYEAEREHALQDNLTGLGNHRAFQEELGRQYDQSLRYRVPFALLLIDLDEFKQVNDTMGHATGDDLLVEVGRLMRSTIRQADRGFRTGGDEFAVVMPHTDSTGAADLGRRLLGRMLEDRSAGTYRRPISFSGGVAAYPEHASDRTDLLARADAALYRSKRAGRTLITTFDAAVDRPSLADHERALLSTKLAQLVADRAISAVYQPMVHLETGRAIAYEGLIRPAHGRGFESTVALFTAAELTGRITELDRACLEAVVAGAAAVPPDVYISLNISPRTFEAPEFSASTFMNILSRYRVPPGRVILELTEREAIHDIDRVRRALDECRSMGVQIAADDVGAGNAGLRLLAQIKFDVVKIDLSLVQANAGQEPVASVLQSLVDLANRWGALVVAEGVETAEQLRLIHDLGIGAAQGYLLARPGPIDPSVRFDIEALMGPEPMWWHAEQRERPKPRLVS
jgi:diguanylate cyclase (GGDEF)-like protein